MDKDEIVKINEKLFPPFVLFNTIMNREDQNASGQNY
jgi:hypothetical protein